MHVPGLVITGLAPGQEYRLPDGFDWLVLPGIKKSEGIYVVVDFNATPATAAELDRQLGLNESILRTKILRKDA